MKGAWEPGSLHHVKAQQEQAEPTEREPSPHSSLTYQHLGLGLPNLHSVEKKHLWYEPLRVEC